MTITKTLRGDYQAVYRGQRAYGYSFVEAIINLLTLIY